MTKTVRHVLLAGLTLMAVSACGTTSPATSAPATADSHGFQVQQTAAGYGAYSPYGGYGAYGGMASMLGPGAYGAYGNMMGGANPYGMMSPWGNMMSPYGYGAGAWGAQNPYGNWAQAGWGQPGLGSTSAYNPYGSSSPFNQQTMNMLVSAVLQVLQSGLSSGQVSSNALTVR